MTDSNCLKPGGCKLAPPISPCAANSGKTFPFRRRSQAAFGLDWNGRKKPNSSKELRRNRRKMSTLVSTWIAEKWEKYFPYVPKRATVRFPLRDIVFV